MRLISDLDDGYWNKDVLELLDELKKAVVMLDTLAQIQACVGGLSMQGRASETNRTRAALEYALPLLKKAAEDDSHRMQENRRPLR